MKIKASEMIKYMISSIIVYLNCEIAYEFFFFILHYSLLRKKIESDVCWFPLGRFLQCLLGQMAASPKHFGRVFKNVPPGVKHGFNTLINTLCKFDTKRISIYSTCDYL